MDEFRIDSHKLVFHPRRTADWLEGRPLAPIYLEISPSGGCNHRCRFCGLDYVGYPNRQLPLEVIVPRLSEMGAAGVKSLMFAGEGEPFLHRDMPAIAEAAKGAGLDISFTTNGVLFAPDKAAAILPLASWIKISCNAGSAETYARVHGAPAGDFEKMWRNLEAAAALRAKLGAACTLGLQVLVLPENRAEIGALAARARAAGVDYLVIKPYSTSPKSLNTAYRELRYDDCRDLDALAGLNTDTFKTIFRRETMARLAGPQTYPRCLALPFWGYIDSGGDFWGCLRHIGEEPFHYGNLTGQGFAETLNSPARLEKLRRWAESGDIGECRAACRMDAVNSYLWALRNPGPHVNFI